MKQELMEPEIEHETETIKKTEIKKQKDQNSITDLPGVGAATAEKLTAVGYNDLMSIAVATPAELIDAT